MMTIFIAPRVMDQTPDEILAEVEAATDAIEKIFSEDEPVIHWVWNPLHTILDYLSESMKYIDWADAVYFCAGWENDITCQIIHEVCEKLNIQRIET